MYAERMIIETDPAGNLKQLPKLPANCRIEAIFLIMDEQSQIANTAQVLGNVLSSSAETADSLLAESYGSWGKLAVAEVTALIETQRRHDLGNE